MALWSLLGSLIRVAMEGCAVCILNSDLYGGPVGSLHNDQSWLSFSIADKTSAPAHCAGPQFTSTPLLFQALLCPSSLQRPHRQPEAPPSAAWSSPTCPRNLLPILPNGTLLSVTSAPSVLMKLGWGSRTFLS